MPRKCKNGTDDCSVGPAMTRAECTQAMETGIALALDAKAQGADILLTGEMGIGNTTTACAVASVLLGRDPAALVGRGSGLSNAAFLKNSGAATRPLPEITRTRRTRGGPGQRGGAGLSRPLWPVSGGAFVRLPVLLDGFIADAAALCAVRLCPAAGDALLASHVSAEPGPRRSWRGWACRHLSAPACAWGGQEAVMALPLLDMALAATHSGHTFGALGIDAYTPQH
ncbi:MAG: nicotinate-nucleotide--dimethylbenzimidazole phosphoribosyltransferase [Evtepia sp.]